MWHINRKKKSWRVQKCNLQRSALNRKILNNVKKYFCFFALCQIFPSKPWSSHRLGLILKTIDKKVYGTYSLIGLLWYRKKLILSLFKYTDFYVLKNAVYCRFLRSIIFLKWKFYLNGHYFVANLSNLKCDTSIQKRRSWLIQK